jgi:hypothetical protein
MAAEFRNDLRLRPLIEARQHLRTPEETLDTYRMVNRPESGRAQAEMEWMRMIERPTVGDVGRIRLAGWEVRNLRMIANIRQAMSGHPGGRVLVLVGAGHKPWFDAYLRVMPDVRIVDVATVLR